MPIEILYFARIRETIGKGSEALSPPASITTIAQLIDWLTGLSPAHQEAFADRAKLRAAIDDAFVGLDASIAGAREIALFPPVTGG